MPPRCAAAVGEFDDPTAAPWLLREIRAADALVSRLDPARVVLMLSGSAGEWVPLRAFEAGCDDFLGKPVSHLELRARVRAILRRTMRETTPRRVGALVVDPHRLEARYAAARLELARPEFALLCQLAADPLRVVTKRSSRGTCGATRRTGGRDVGRTRVPGAQQARGRALMLTSSIGAGLATGLVDRVPDNGRSFLSEGRPSGSI